MRWNARHQTDALKRIASPATSNRRRLELAIDSVDDRPRTTLSRLELQTNTMRTRPLSLFMSLLVIMAGASIALFGQTPVPLVSDGALLSEIRGLRADINTALSANVRAQVFVGRLQLQEQRLNTLMAQLTAVRNSLASMTSDRLRMVERAESLGNALTDSRVSEQRREIEGALQEAKRELSALDASRQQLVAQEVDLSAQLATEQGRWNYFNDSLDQIEASLQQIGRK